MGCGTVDAAPTAVVGLHLPQLQQGGHHNRMQLADAAATSTLSSSTGENLGILPKLSCDVCKVGMPRDVGPTPLHAYILLPTLVFDG